MMAEDATLSKLPSLFLIAALISPTFAETRPGSAEAPPIQDNSFLVEEAYNQESGVVQHISSLTRLWNSRDWSYSFTEEWPGLNPRHQFSYTLTGMHSGDCPGSGAGLGDVALNYRYQLAGRGDTRVAFAPRLSFLAPTGSVAALRGYGTVAAQFNAPVSVVLTRRLVSHWNVGGTVAPRAQAPDRTRATAVGFNLGQSLVYLAHPRLNLLVETAAAGFQSAAPGGRTEWRRTLFVSPGLRWAHNFASGMQIVPGFAIPVGIGASAGETGVILYLSFEAPMPRFYRRLHGR